MGEQKAEKNTVTLFADEVVLVKGYIRDIERLESLSRRVGLTQGLLASSLFVLFAAFYGFGISGDSPNWIGLVLTAIIGYILYRAFENLQDYEKNLEHQVKILKAARKNKDA